MRVGTLLVAAIACTGAAPADRFRAALVSADLIAADPTLTKVKRLCGLKLAGKSYHAIGIVERIKLAQSDRLARRVIILDSDLRRVRQMRYSLPARALPCRGNVLRFSTPVPIDNTYPASKKIRVVDEGHTLVALPPFSWK